MKLFFAIFLKLSRLPNFLVLKSSTYLFLSFSSLCFRTNISLSMVLFNKCPNMLIFLLEIVALSLPFGIFGVDLVLKMHLICVMPKYMQFEEKKQVWSKLE